MFNIDQANQSWGDEYDTELQKRDEFAVLVDDMRMW